MTFVLDNMIPYRIAGALRELRQDVIALRDEWPENTPDEVWLRELGHRGWPFITADKRIRTRPQQQQVYKSANVTAFFLGPFWGKLQFWGQAVWLITHWPRLTQVTQAFAVSVRYAVRQNGKMYPLPY